MIKKIKLTGLALFAIAAVTSVTALLPATALAHDNCTNMGDFKRGSYGVCVRHIQTIVNNIGLGRADVLPVWLPGWYGYAHLTVDGSFGSATETQVKKFQGSFDNLTPDGRVGQNTWKTMCRTVKTYRNFGLFKPYWPEGKDANQISRDSYDAAHLAGCVKYDSYFTYPGQW